MDFWAGYITGLGVAALCGVYLFFVFGPWFFRCKKEHPTDERILGEAIPEGLDPHCRNSHHKHYWKPNPLNWTPEND